MRTLNAQEMFDIAVGGVLRQGGPGVIKNGTRCRLRGDDGTKCAFGHMIPDEHYEEWMAGFGVQTVVDKLIQADKIDLSAGVMQNSTGRRLIHELMYAHDFFADDMLGGPPPADYLAKFAGRARAIADWFRLSPAILDQLQPA